MRDRDVKKTINIGCAGENTEVLPLHASNPPSTIHIPSHSRSKDRIEKVITGRRNLS